MASSVDEHDGSGRKNKKEKDRKPANTAFRQQRLKAWQPILTPKTVLPLFFIIGIIFAPIGGLLLYASAQVQELVIDYTDCDQANPNENTTVPSDKFTASFKTALDKSDYPKWSVQHDVKAGALKENKNYTEKNVCTLTFTLPNDLNPPIYVYYRLTNFFQNHRRYVQSLSKDQMKGQALSKSSLHSDCNPLDGSGDKPYYPCGLIANSVFNDTFGTIKQLSPKATEEGNPSIRNYNFTNKGIAWNSDADQFDTTKYNYTDVLPPPDWHDKYPNGYTADMWPPNFKENEELQVWMRTAGLPTFSKMALRNDNETMQKSTYSINIYYRFPVREYKGTKSIVITTRTVMGGKNPFLGIAYVVVGGLCILLGAVFTARHLFKPRKLGDHTYLSWNNDDQAGHATATGRDMHH